MPEGVDIGVRPVVEGGERHVKGPGVEVVVDERCRCHRAHLGHDADLGQLVRHLGRDPLVGRHVTRYRQPEAKTYRAFGADAVDKRPAGVVEQLGGGRWVVGRLLGGAVKGPGDRTRNRSIIRHGLATEHVANNGSAVDGFRDRLANPDVLEVGFIALLVEEQLRILIGGGGEHADLAIGSLLGGGGGGGVVGALSTLTCRLARSWAAPAGVRLPRPSICPRSSASSAAACDGKLRIVMVSSQGRRQAKGLRSSWIRSVRLATNRKGPVPTGLRLGEADASSPIGFPASRCPGRMSRSSRLARNPALCPGRAKRT